MKRLEGKWALITGASRGVGKQITMALAAEGCKLILHSRDKSHTDALTAELRAFNSSASLLGKCDVCCRDVIKPS